VEKSLENPEKPQTLRYFKILKCSFITVKSAFKILKSLDFRDSIHFISQLADIIIFPITSAKIYKRQN